MEKIYTRSGGRQNVLRADGDGSNRRATSLQAAAIRPRVETCACGVTSSFATIDFP
jgi:hypothetical protein